MLLVRTLRAGPLQSLTTPCLSFSRPLTYSSTAFNSKPSISNIAEIRRLLPGTTMVKAKEALTSAQNDIQSALAWLEKDSAISGAKKASKVGNRQAKEGGVGITIIVDGAPSTASNNNLKEDGSLTLAAKAGIVELNCETDFVGRNEIFQSLLRDIAHTVALFPTLAMSDTSPTVEGGNKVTQELVNIPTAALLEFPLMSSELKQQQSGSRPRSVGDAILDVISRLGEKIHLARASALSNVSIPAANAPRRSEGTVNTPWLVASAFTHGGVGQQPTNPSAASSSPVFFSSTGKVASLLLTRFDQPKLQNRRDDGSLKAMRAMARSLARQSAGMPTSRIRGDDESSLYNQVFMMKLNAANLPEQKSKDGEEESVANALTEWGKTWMGGAAIENGLEPHVSVLELRRWELGEEIEVSAT